MRRKLVHMVVAAAVALVPVWAMAGNQEFAEEIAASLRDSGRLQDYKVGVKFQEGTAWLRGQVTSQEQMNAALKEVLGIRGVDRVVNNLEIAPASSPQQASGVADAANILRSPTAGLSVRQRMAASQTAARLEQASLNTLRSRTHPIEVVPSSPAVDRLATSFTAEPVQPAAVTTPKASPIAKKLIPISPQRLGSQPARRTTKTPTKAQAPLAVAMASAPTAAPTAAPAMGAPMPQYVAPVQGGMPPAQYDQPNMPNYAWPSYAAHPNYAALTYPKQYSPTAWPFIGPFYPYPQVPLGWRKVTLEWHDGWWQLDFDDGPRNQWFSGLFRAPR